MHGRTGDEQGLPEAERVEGRGDEWVDGMGSAEQQAASGEGEALER